MTDEHQQCAATPAAELERQIVDPCVGKNEREWWAAREIERLREVVEAAEHRAVAAEAERDELRVELQDAQQPRGYQQLIERTTAAQSALQEALAREAGYRDALEAIDGQAVCAGMDGPDGNAKMLEYIHDVADKALSTTSPHPWGEVVRAAQNVDREFGGRLLPDKHVDLQDALNALSKALSALPTSAAPSDTAALIDVRFPQTPSKLARPDPHGLTDGAPIIEREKNDAG